MLSEVFDTLRLLMDSIDFSEEDSHGWDIMDTLCSHACFPDIHLMANVDLLLSILRLLSFDLRTYVSKQRFAEMLYWVIDPEPGLAEASDLLLDLGGHDIIDTGPFLREGVSLLHRMLAFSSDEYYVNFVLSRNPDVHRLGLDTFLSPYKESPTSLAMYSWDAFISWLRALVNNKVDLESFIDRELGQNHEVHPGWVKETLLHLFTYDDWPDLQSDRFSACSDCKALHILIMVQPYWRHILERIRTRLQPYEPNTAGSEAKEENDDNELAPESESDKDTSTYIARGPINSNCLYDKREVVCIDCWLHYARTGTRKLPVEELSESEHPASDDDSSEDDFSPFHIHS